MSGFLEYKFKNLRQNPNIMNFAFENLKICIFELQKFKKNCMKTSKTQKNMILKNISELVCEFTL